MSTDNNHGNHTYDSAYQSGQNQARQGQQLDRQGYNETSASHDARVAGYNYEQSKKGSGS